MTAEGEHKAAAERIVKVAMARRLREIPPLAVVGAPWEVMQAIRLLSRQRFFSPRWACCFTVGGAKPAEVRRPAHCAHLAIGPEV